MSGFRRIYLARFGLLPIEARLSTLYASLRYEAVFIPFMWEAGWGAGAVNCLTSGVRARLPVDFAHEWRFSR